MVYIPILQFHTFWEQFRKYIAIKMYPFVCTYSRYPLYRSIHAKVMNCLGINCISMKLMDWRIVSVCPWQCSVRQWPLIECSKFVNERFFLISVVWSLCQTWRGFSLDILTNIQGRRTIFNYCPFVINKTNKRIK